MNRRLKISRIIFIFSNRKVRRIIFSLQTKFSSVQKYVVVSFVMVLVLLAMLFTFSEHPHYWMNQARGIPLKTMESHMRHAQKIIFTIENLKSHRGSSLAQIKCPKWQIHEILVPLKIYCYTVHIYNHGIHHLVCMSRTIIGEVFSVHFPKHYSITLKFIKQNDYLIYQPKKERKNRTKRTITWIFKAGKCTTSSFLMWYRIGMSHTTYLR